LADLLAFFDERVGKGRYLLAMTSDHGVCPLPEVSRRLGRDAGRINQFELAKKAGAFLSERFRVNVAKPKWFEPPVSAWIYLNRQTLKAADLNPDDVAAALAGWLKEQEGIGGAYTRSQIQNGLPADDAWGQSVARSFHPQRCGDLFVILKPHYLFASSYFTGTTHGTPHAYDTHVPLLFMGPGIPSAGVCDELVAPGCIAAVFAHSLGIDPPAKATQPIPRRVLQSP
jgi:hypothetical protein